MAREPATKTASGSQASDGNLVLKLKFHGLHSKVVNNVNPADIIDFLFQEKVLEAQDMRALHLLKNDPQQQCRELLALLHTSNNPQAFVQLYRAIKNESHLQWLIDQIDEYRDQSLINLELQQLYISNKTVGQLVHSLPEGKPVVGVTLLAGEVYLLRLKERDEVEVYDVVTYRLQRCLTVPNAVGFTDMTSCEHNLCVYIGDHNVECVHRLDKQGAATRWTVSDKPRGLSVNAAHNVIVTCPAVHKIKVFSSYGDLLRELQCPSDVIHPCHAIQTRSGQFIVCHGYRDDTVNRVCVISDDGRHVVHSHGGQRGSNSDQYNVPGHLAVDDNEFVFVADFNNRRVTLLSPMLEYVRHAVLCDQLKWYPGKVCSDNRLLYVIENEWKDGMCTAGRAVVFRV